MWLNQLKIAIVEKNIDKLNKLIDDIPELKDKEDLDSAICLLKEATDFLTSLKDKTEFSMTQIQNNTKFLKSTTTQRTSKLDIKL